MLLFTEISQLLSNLDGTFDDFLHPHSYPGDIVVIFSVLHIYDEHDEELSNRASQKRQ